MSKTMILDFIRKEILKLNNENKLGSANNYKRLLNSLSTFLGDTDIAISKITSSQINAYNNWLMQRGITRNSASFYMRILRAVFNKAVSRKLVKQTFPFKCVYTGIDKTRKKAVDEQIFLSLLSLDLSRSTSLALARDIFIFSYSTRGMAFIDIAFLKNVNRKNDTITYSRHKTGQTLSIKLETCALRILEKYASQKSEYLFPILKSPDFKTAYKEYLNALSYYNKQLKRFSQLIDCPTTLSSYTARHSWATVAKRHNIPLAVISESMGHTSEKTTLIYLASIDNSVIDNANHTILEPLNRYVSK